MTKYDKFLPYTIQIIEVDEEFLIVGVLRENSARQQIDYFREYGFGFSAIQELENKIVVLSLVSREELDRIHEVFEDLARRHMGRFKAFATAMTGAYRILPDSPHKGSK